MSYSLPPNPANPTDLPTDDPAHEGDEAYLRYRASGKQLSGFDLDPREQMMWARRTRRVKLTQAAVVFWLCASPFVVVPLVLRHDPWWVAAVAAGVIGAVIGYLLPTNVPPPRRAPIAGEAYGIYDPRGPYGPRS